MLSEYFWQFSAFASFWGGGGQLKQKVPVGPVRGHMFVFARVNEVDVSLNAEAHFHLYPQLLLRLVTKELASAKAHPPSAVQ